MKSPQINPTPSQKSDESCWSHSVIPSGIPLTTVVFSCREWRGNTAVLAPWGSPKLPSGRTSLRLCREYPAGNRCTEEFLWNSQVRNTQESSISCLCTGRSSLPSPSVPLPGLLRGSLVVAPGTGTPGLLAGGATAGSPARPAPPVGHTELSNSPPETATAPLKQEQFLLGVTGIARIHPAFPFPLSLPTLALGELWGTSFEPQPCPRKPQSSWKLLRQAGMGTWAHPAGSDLCLSWLKHPTKAF